MDSSDSSRLSAKAHRLSRLIANGWFWTGVLLTGALALSLLPRNATVPAALSEDAVTLSDSVAVASGKVDIEGGIISVAARRPGTITKVYVKEGDQVTQGQVLAQQDDMEAKLEVEHARASLSEAEAQILELQLKLTAAEREHKRLTSLAGSNAVSQQLLDLRADEIRAIRAAIAAKEATMERLNAQLKKALYELELTTIRAPTDGLIVRRYANPGEGASTLNVSTMFDLAPDAPLIVRAQIDESALPFVSVGQRVAIIPEADTAKTYEGKVLRRSTIFGARTLQPDDPYERTDERVLEVVVSAAHAPLLVGQRVIVKFVGGNDSKKPEPPR